MTARAPFFKKRRMKYAEPNNLDRKSGIWGTLTFVFPAAEQCLFLRLASHSPDKFADAVGDTE